MRVSLPGRAVISGRARSLRSPLILLVLAALVTWAIYTHFHKAPPEHINAGTDPTTSQFLDAEEKAIQSSAAAKDYQTTINSCLAASSDAYVQGQYTQSKNILLGCIQKIPDNQVTWDIYSGLANTAQKLKDSSLEKSSLQTAIKKASQPGSGVDPSIITAMQNKLQAIK